MLGHGPPCCLYDEAHKKTMEMLLKFIHEIHALKGAAPLTSKPFASEDSLVRIGWLGRSFDFDL